MSCWSMKPLFGLLSDALVVNGYRRTPWPRGPPGRGEGGGSRRGRVTERVPTRNHLLTAHPSRRTGGLFSLHRLGPRDASLHPRRSSPYPDLPGTFPSPVQQIIPTPGAPTPLPTDRCFPVVEKIPPPDGREPRPGIIITSVVATVGYAAIFVAGRTMGPMLLCACFFAVRPGGPVTPPSPVPAPAPCNREIVPPVQRDGPSGPPSPSLPFP